MKCYLCIVNNFDGVRQVFLDCISRGMYAVCDEYKQKGALGSVRKGDLLLLVYEKQLRGYAYAASEFKDGEGDYNGWKIVETEGGWNRVKKGVILPYGYFKDKNVIDGNKRSVVKCVKEEWAMTRLQEMKQSLAATSFGRSHFVNIVELAHHSQGDNPYYAIPEIQRGLVWNAVRCEVLWDSLLRGLPIGAISVRRSEDGRHLDIFDGQQRTNTISLGYVDWEPHRPMPSEKERPVLWLDMGADQSQVDCDDGPNRNKSLRKYIFRVTTAAHPWGYKLTDNETKDCVFSVGEQKESVRLLDRFDSEHSKSWERKGERISARPYPGEMWPIGSKLPVPFTILRRYVDLCQDELSWDGFVAWCQDSYPETNWVRHFFTKDVPELDESVWENHIRAVEKLSTRHIICINADQVSEADIGLYFKRMNTGGVPLDEEEISYSLLKSKIKGLKILDNCAAGRCQPSRLATIVMRYWLSKNNSWRWQGGISHAQIEEISRDQEAFRNFLKEGLVEHLKKIEERLRVDTDNGLLKWHLRSLYNVGDGSIVVYLLREIERERRDCDYVALSTYICWFSPDISGCVRALWDATTPAEGVYNAINKGQLYRLFYPDEIERYFNKRTETINEHTKSSEWDTLHHSNDMSAYFGEALDRIWNGFNNKQGCELLLFANRRFVKRVFDYDMSRPEWQNQNRPWDYDHILPKSWVGDRRVSQYTYLVRDFLWSIGNSAPIPFSLNRGKSNLPPGEGYPDITDPNAADELYVDRNAVSCYVGQLFKDSKGNRWDRLDRSYEDSRDFIRYTCERFVKLVNNGWLNACDFTNVLKICGKYEKRQKLISSLAESFGLTMNTYFWGADGAMHHTSKDLDWARNDLVSGIECIWQDDNKGEHECLLAIMWTNKMAKIGMHRLPTTSDIDGDTAKRWFMPPVEINEDDIANIKTSIRCLAEKIIVKHHDTANV